jgi:hypothetical protein
MDPSITSKTTILFDVTTILLSLLQQLLWCINDSNVHDRSCCSFISNCNSFFLTCLIKDEADDHGGTTISNGVTCDVLL